MAMRNAAVAAADQWRDPDDGIRYPAGEVHAWDQGRNETVCGLSLSRSRLARFPHVTWQDVQPESGRHAEGVQEVCRRCAEGLGARRGHHIAEPHRGHERNRLAQGQAGGRVATVVAMPVRCARRSSSERRNAGPPERPRMTAQPGPP